MSLLRQKPLLRIVLERATRRGSAQPGQPAQAGQGNAQVQDAMQGVMSLVDTNNDGQLQATELRQTVQTGVQGLYAGADTDRDGQLTPTELNAAVTGMVQAAAQASFQAADKDGNGPLSQAEFDQIDHRAGPHRLPDHRRQRRRPDLAAGIPERAADREPGRFGCSTCPSRPTR